MQTFKFWKDNKLNQEFNLTKDQLISRFRKWLPNKEYDWLHYYGSYQIIPTFIAEKEGLSSVFEQSDLHIIIDELEPEFYDYMSSLDIISTDQL